ncbi:MAG: 2Fe-2S iron-sulfur cluster-binding protein [Candidatus Roizmanbacteria bacterium]|nr:2Fe-2S iron-sulfur cluster-binding protein [Candidatus Roizmanbacteria bacterium]
MVKIRVKDIEGVEHLFDLQKDEQKSIVDIAEEQGIELPYSCRSGACFSCCAEIKKGKQRLDREKTGEQLIDVEEEEFLCCIGGVDSSAFTAEEEAEITLEMQN